MALFAKNICWESQCVTQKMMSDWFTSTLLDLMKDNFYTDEAGLFYCYVLNKNLVFKGKRCLGEKNVKND